MGEVTIDIYGTPVALLKEPTAVHGLAFRPRFRDYDNAADWLPFTRPAAREVSDRNFAAVAALPVVGPVLEIGVSRNGERSLTAALLKAKPDGVPYLGVDIEDKSALEDPPRGVFTLRCSSFDQGRVRARLAELGAAGLGLLLIDGWHSLDAVVNDWLYAELVVRGGHVVLHDTNGHPPAAFIHAIDRNLYDVERMFVGEDDYGLTVCTKK